MRKALITVALSFTLLVQGCKCTISQDAVDGIDRLVINTNTICDDYQALLQRSGPPPGPPGETPEQAAEREAAWKEKVEHDLALIGAQKLLAEKTNNWAKAVAPSQETEE